MSGPCVWSEEALVNRHPRYRALFAKRDRPDRSRSRTSTSKSLGGGQEEASLEVNDTRSDPAGMELPARTRGQSSPPPPLPAAPKPSADEAIHEANAKAIQEQEENGIAKPDYLKDEAIDLFKTPPAQAMAWLCVYVQHLLTSSGQKLPKPPTPPSSGNSSKVTSPLPTPGSTDENHRPSQINIQVDPAPPSADLTSPGPTSPQHPFLQRVPRASRTPIDSPVSHPQSPIPSTHPESPTPLPLDKTTHIIAQSDKLARKFYCKSAPPVLLSDYLERLHKYCPLKTGVYISAGIYIERLTRRRSPDQRRNSFVPLTPVSSNSGGLVAGHEAPTGEADETSGDAPLVEVTSKSVHRLLLAALRVAQKGLEDGIFPHRRVALVGGVSELELSRLEVSMCFLTDFEVIPKLWDMERWVRKVKALDLVGPEQTQAKTPDTG